MTKKIIGGIAIVAIALTMALNVSLNAKNNSLSDLALANVEALARPESGEELDDYGYGWVQVPEGYRQCCVYNFPGGCFLLYVNGCKAYIF